MFHIKMHLNLFKKPPWLGAMFLVYHILLVTKHHLWVGKNLPYIPSYLAFKPTQEKQP